MFALLRKIVAVTVAAWGLLPGTASARPEAPAIFCAQVPDSPLCTSGQTSCQTCHAAEMPARNDFGKCLGQRLDHSEDFGVSLEQALASVAKGECVPQGPSTPKATETTTSRTFNLAFATARALRDFCGRSPTFEEAEKARSGSGKGELEAITKECFKTAYWRGRDGVLWRMAHAKVRPIATLKSGDNGGRVPLGDYDDDYNLYVFHQLDGADVRGVLTADYYVVRNDSDLSYERVEDMPLHDDAKGHTALIGGFFGGVQQFVRQDRRAGMLTTKWTLAMNTMFTVLPRTAAARAARSYLGIDIAKGEGLDRVPEDGSFELHDFDKKGVTAKGCADCHNVLDPLSYPFSTYSGLNFQFSKDDPEIQKFIQRDDAVERVRAYVEGDNDVLLPGTYKTNRVEVLARMQSQPDLAKIPEAGFFFGAPVKDLKEWAEHAANSDDFAKKVALDYWTQLFQGKPAEQDKPAFDAMVQALKTSNYSVDAMLLDLVGSDYYGTP